MHIGNKRHKRIKREVEQYSLERNKEVQKQEREEEEETFFFFIAWRVLRGRESKEERGGDKSFVSPLLSL